MRKRKWLDPNIAVSFPGSFSSACANRTERIPGCLAPSAYYYHGYERVIKAGVPLTERSVCLLGLDGSQYNRHASPSGY